MELHLEVDLLRLACGDVDPDLAHRLDHVRPDRLRGGLPGRLGAQVWRRVALEERLRDLASAGVVGADEEHVPHGDPSSRCVSLPGRARRRARSTRRSISSRIGRTCSSGRSFGSRSTQLIRRTPGVTGQTSSLQVETAMSAHASASCVELARDVVARVDPDLLQRLDDLRMRCRPGLASRGARLVPSLRGPAEEALRHHAAAAVGDADEEDVITPPPRTLPGRAPPLVASARRGRTGRRARRATPRARGRTR